MQENYICMAKKSERRILFVICEGDSDDITLHRSLKNYFGEYVKNLIVEVTEGDFAYKKDINDENCVKYVEKIVNEHKKRNYLFSSDYIAVIHIIDTDGAFMNLDNIKEDVLLDYNKFEHNTLFTNNRTFMLERFETKASIYTKLFVTNLICGIKYYKFYFSRNLEHALYGVENATIKDKIKLSNSFDAMYKQDAISFENKLKEIMYEIPNNYDESWNYIFSDNNSIKRCSNISLIFGMIKHELKI